MKTRIPYLSLAFVMAISTVARDAWACPVCFGDPNSPMVHAMNWAILLLLGITGGVLTGFAAFIVYLFKRSRMMLGEGVDEARSAQSGGGY